PSADRITPTGTPRSRSRCHATRWRRRPRQEIRAVGVGRDRALPVADPDPVRRDEDDLGPGELDLLGELPFVEDAADALRARAAVVVQELLGEQQPMGGAAFPVEQDEALPVTAHVPRRNRRVVAEAGPEIVGHLAHRGGIGGEGRRDAPALRRLQRDDRVADRPQLALGGAARAALAQYRVCRRSPYRRSNSTCTSPPTNS